MSAADVATKNLPHWDMTPFFPGLDSAEFAGAVDKVIAFAGDLEGRYG